ncbi:MAG: HAMP domain-containing histidine kinase [Clostridia bacterium]|nr:HAMP domain-containing histidine kinase [Clostridia bacterium]MBQ9792355.1 HAMP domain-containing histidine kinase [Clostridia bacterium]MBQ9793275.1 HAMP domain-containing histidine kinase [Clostridia bacterium]
MKNNKNGFSGFSILGFFLFFFTLAFVSIGSIIIYNVASVKSNGNTIIIILSVLATILLGTIICTTIDIYRRKMMIERPVQKILEATKKIASGDFSVKLVPTHDYNKYDQYDIIFDNINTMTRELSKNEILKNDFISNVSHEIKTPLSVIQNYAKALQNDNLILEKREEYLKGLVIQTKKLSNLISNILKLNKLENQQIVPEIEEIDLAELLRVTTLEFESLFDKKHIELVCDIDDLKITSSATLLEIVFNNLISNAIKFTESGGKVVISLKEEKNYAVIKVSDTGCGISKEVGQHIFDKFYQGDTSHSLEGNGLGLALVKKVIDLIGGQISVESKFGVGSTFIIKLKKD